jgi:hypothetical protein
MDLTSLFLELIEQRLGAGKRAIESKSRSRLASESNTLFSQIVMFEEILNASYNAYVGYHQLIVNAEASENTLYFDEKKRSQLQNEVVQFISTAAKTIQVFTNQLDDSVNSVNSSQLQYNQQVISQLMHRLNILSRLWESMQKEQLRQFIKPSRIFSQFYRKGKLTNNDNNNSNSNFSAKGNSGRTSAPSTPLKEKSKLVPETVDHSFAQRYVDEIAPPAKMKEYENIPINNDNFYLKKPNRYRKGLAKILKRVYD